MKVLRSFFGYIVDHDLNQSFEIELKAIYCNYMRDFFLIRQICNGPTYE